MSFKQSQNPANRQIDLGCAQQTQTVVLVIDYALDYLGGAQAAFLDQAAALSGAGCRVVIVAPGNPTESTYHVYGDHSGGSDTACGCAQVASDPQIISAQPACDVPLAAKELSAAQKIAKYFIKPAGTVPVIALPVLRNTPQLRAELKRLLQNLGANALHTHSEFGLSAAAIAAARELKIPVAHTVHTFFWEARLQGIIDKIAAFAVQKTVRFLTGEVLLRADLAAKCTDATLRAATLSTAMRADIVFSPSAHQAAALQKAGVLNVQVLPNPSVPAVSRKSSAKKDVKQPAPYSQVELPLRLVWVGRLVPEKRLLEFIAAVKIACEDRATANKIAQQTSLKNAPPVAVTNSAASSTFEVTIIGAGPLEKRAKKAAKGLPIKFAGRLNREDVAACMEQAHALVLTSFGFDNQPVVIVEAVNAARPVILCDKRLREGLQHGSGIYSQSEQPQSLAKLFLELAAEPERLMQASLATQKDKQDFDPQNHVEKLLSAYLLAASV